MGDIQSIRESLKKNLLLKEWEDEGDDKWESLYLSQFAGINAGARKLGIDISSARLINTRRTNMTASNIKDASEGFHQWYSMGTAWLDWIQGNMPDWLAPCTYAIEFSRNPLIINSEPILQMFSKKYIKNMDMVKDAAINWEKAYHANIGAIEFNPYNREWADSFPWYGSIDMASGAIVMKSIIKNVVKLYDGTDDFRDAGLKI